jgi:hypothetical protein
VRSPLDTDTDARLRLTPDFQKALTTDVAVLDEFAGDSLDGGPVFASDLDCLSIQALQLFIDDCTDSPIHRQGLRNVIIVRGR